MGHMLDGIMAFEAPHALDDSQVFEDWVCDAFCCDVYVYSIVNCGVALPSACKQAGLWGCHTETGLGLANSTSISGQVRLGG